MYCFPACLHGGDSGPPDLPLEPDEEPVGLDDLEVLGDGELEVERVLFNVKALSGVREVVYVGRAVDV